MAKRKWSWMKYRKDDPAHNVMVAVQRWIHANKGTALVMSGVEVQDWGDGEGKYRVAVQILGVKPVKRKPAQPSGEREK